jgi:hypothetical protein
METASSPGSFSKYLLPLLRNEVEDLASPAGFEPASSP